MPFVLEASAVAVTELLQWARIVHRKSIVTVPITVFSGEQAKKGILLFQHYIFTVALYGYSA